MSATKKPVANRVRRAGVRLARPVPDVRTLTPVRDFRILSIERLEIGVMGIECTQAAEYTQTMNDLGLFTGQIAAQQIRECRIE